MRILSRFLFLQALGPIAGCLVACVFLVMVFDMFDNLSDLVVSGAGWERVLEFYLFQIPWTVAFVLPSAVLVGGLFALIGLARNSEIIAMQGCGLSLWQIAMPFLLVGALASGLQGWLHWELGPLAQRKREVILEEFRSNANRAEGETKKRAKRKVNLESLVYRSRDTRRLWFVERAELGTQKLRNVEILQMTDDGRDVWKYYVKSLLWDGNGWRLSDVLRIDYDENGDIIKKTPIPLTVDPELNETFAQVTSTTLQPDVLSAPELRSYVLENQDLGPQRMAPFLTFYYYRVTTAMTCLSCILLALSYGTGATRRQSFTGFGKAALLFCAYLTVVHFFLALGKGGRLSPLIAGALPPAVFLMFSLFLFVLRARNVQIPTLAELVDRLFGGSQDEPQPATL